MYFYVLGETDKTALKTKVQMKKSWLGVVKAVLVESEKGAGSFRLQVKLEMYLQALGALKEPSAGSFVKSRPWSKPACPGMTWGCRSNRSPWRFGSVLPVTVGALQGHELLTELSPKWPPFLSHRGRLLRCPGHPRGQE